MSDLQQPELLLSIIGIVFFLGVLGGSYPAFYLSSFQPVKVLKGKFVQAKGTVPLRKVLVVVQFTISITMVISTLVVFDQLEFLRNQDLGFNKEKVMVIRYPKQSMLEKYSVLRGKFSNIAGIENMATAESSPGRGHNKNLLPVETADGFVEKGVNYYPVDADFIPTLGIKIIEGRNFDKSLASDSNAIIVNQLFAKRNGWVEPLGKRIRLDDEENIYATVIGVMDDFHQLSLYQEMEPLVFFYGENRPIIHVRFDPNSLKTIEEEMETVWKEVYPDTPLEKYFLDQHFFKSYEADQKRSDVFTIFSGITIFIACIGLLGLASFSTQQRKKEIGIRKVIGAKTSQILIMLTKEFFVLVGISMLLAFGMAYYLMSNWLDETFVYHTQLQPATFIFSGFMAMVFVILTIGYHAFKSANSNPIDALMTE